MRSLTVYEREFLLPDEAYRSGWYFLYMKVEHGPYDTCEEASAALEELLDNKRCKNCED